jgi:hypothetical protein
VLTESVFVTIVESGNDALLLFPACFDIVIAIPVKDIRIFSAGKELLLPSEVFPLRFVRT